MTAAVAGAVATCAGIAPSRAANKGDAHARSGHAHLSHVRHFGKTHTARRRHSVSGGLDGIASVYRDRFTASGERMNPNAMTAAHKFLPMGSHVTVHNKRNGRSVTVRINDRGPYVAGRVIDLSPGAARIIGLSGLAPVYLTVDARADDARAGHLPIQP